MRFVVIGEALVDVVPAPEGARDLPGGSPANVAITLGRLGHTPTLVTSLGEDARGGLVRGWLEASSVDVVSAPTASGRTSSATVRLDETGSATYEFDLDWDLPAGLLASQTEGADVVHAGSIATVLDPGADAVEAALVAARGRALVSFDPNARPSITPDVAAVRERVERIVAACDVVKVSDEDLAWYYPGVTPLEAARRWAATGPGLVVVTLGGDGALAVTADASRDAVTIPGVKVDVVDTVGAGDTFMGALLDALASLGAHGAGAREALDALTREQVEEALRWSARAAAVTVSRAGANPPTRAELEG